MEELREQSVITPAPALNEAEENVAVGETDSQQDILGRFKSVEALKDAYENLHKEFTRKSQLLKSYEQDKTMSANEEEKTSVDKMVESTPQEKEESLQEVALKEFLDRNEKAKEYLGEIEERFGKNASQKSNPYEVAWANVVLEHFAGEDKVSDPLINQYILSDQTIKNKIIENYLMDLKTSKPPITISSRKGERVSSVMPETPKTLADAKRLTSKMFE